MPLGSKADYEQRVRYAVERVGMFPVEAFEFVQEGLTWTIERVHGVAAEDVPRTDGSRHITGQQLCEGLRDLAFERWGYLARTVLRAWGILRTEDFGRIVYALIDAGILARSEEDSQNDFADVFDFASAFERDYKIGVSA